jgi:hypothetical protein
MCPGHLVKKWKREVLATIPGARATIIRSLKDVIQLNRKKPEVPEYLVKKGDGDRVVLIDLVTFMGKRKQKVEKVAVKASELDQVLQERGADSVQFSLF